jgi:hypothetical protein
VSSGVGIPPINGFTLNLSLGSQFCIAAAVGALCTNAIAAWTRHVIDGSSKGADGVRLADINGDGLPDITTGWEQGGVTRVYVHPGYSQVTNTWPSVTVGKTPDVEDAVFVDLDSDGAMDVVSSCEGKTRAMFVHWSPAKRDELLDVAAWRTETLPLSLNKQMWMFCLPMQVDGKQGVDLIAGGKGTGAALGWFEAPARPRDLAQWKWHPLRDVGWVMSILATDMDGDGDQDIVFSDRKGARIGCFWLANPGTGAGQFERWSEHVIGGLKREVMFLALGDLDGDGLQDVIACAKPAEILFFRRADGTGTNWSTHVIPLPRMAGSAKAVNSGDIDLDGRTDLIFSCEGAEAPKHGLMWLSRAGSATNGTWTAHEVSGVDGVKYDLVPLVDLDDDGDLDVVTTEEVRGLGVIWYENPTRSRLNQRK